MNENSAVPYAQPELNPGGAIIPLLGRYEAAHIVRYQFAARYLDLGPVVDYGCGYGFGAELLDIMTPNRVLGLDIDPRCIRYASVHYDRPNLEFQRLKKVVIPVPDATVGLITFFETIEHLTVGQLTKFFDETRRVLRPDGVMIGSTPNPAFHRIQDYAFHVREFALEELQAACEDRGFEFKAFGQGEASVAPKQAMDLVFEMIPHQFRRNYFLKILSSLFIGLKRQGLRAGDLLDSVREFNPKLSVDIIFLLTRSNSHAAELQGLEQF